MSLTPETRDQIASLVQANTVMLFMKGTPDSPQCGFSATVVGILTRLVPEFASADVLSDPQLRDGIKEFSDWPTIPQLYVGGEFMGGADIIQEMYAAGELHEALGLGKPEPTMPEIHVTDDAAEVLRQARAQSEHAELHLGIDARFRYQIGFAPRQGGEVVVTSGEFTFLLDPDSAGRADGLTLEVIETPEGRQLHVRNPNDPQPAQA
ncbi:MAG: Grx4 family monothiol glutaredoxin [Deltaproteobacteria bacterium]|nr:Grx4 family monothiol glutaredoxin [Deltaproteobacteria bacterium]MBW2414139.1 Grx4 family monothiol glutaredoxin [Deltaproteobacteria bacterium]